MPLLVSYFVEHGVNLYKVLFSFYYISAVNYHPDNIAFLPPEKTMPTMTTKMTTTTMALLSLHAACFTK